jgi:hypothetical protein
MNGQLPTRWPDIAAWLETYTPTRLPGEGWDGVFVRTEKPHIASDPALVKPYKLIIVSAFPGATITPVTRYVRVTVQAWVVKDNERADLVAAAGLAADFGFIVETAPHIGTPLNFAEIDSGPTRSKDSTTQIEYMAMTLLLEVSAL